MKTSRHYLLLLLFSISMSSGCSASESNLIDNSKGISVDVSETQQERLEEELRELEQASQSGASSLAFLKKRFDGRLSDWRQAADLGSPIAQYFYARCLEEGLGVKRDPVKSFMIYEKGASQGSMRCSVGMACCYRDGEGVTADATKAFQILLKCAERDYPPAQVMVGGCLLEGMGTEVNLARAISWFSKAADLKDADAALSLGVCYVRGQGVEKNELLAIEWFQKAADLGSSHALLMLGSCHADGIGVPKNLENAFQYFLQASEKGVAGAMFEVWRGYENGLGIAADKEKANQWLKKAAESGYSGAQYELGSRYYNGLGVEQDIVKAVAWFTKAGDQDFGPAMNDLAVCYKNGRGVTKDINKANELFRAAAKLGSASAKTNLHKEKIDAPFRPDAEQVLESAFHPQGRERFIQLARQRSVAWQKGAKEGAPTAQFLWALCHHQGIGAPRNPLRANELIEQAARQGSPYALIEMAKGAEAGGNPACIQLYNLAVDQEFPWAEYRLGVVYAEGRVTNQDQKQAFQLILAAAEHGLVVAQTDVGKRFERGIGTAKALPKAFHWYSRAAEQGDAIGHLNVGVCHLLKIGTPGSIVKAKHHLQLADRMGVPLASDYLNSIRKSEAVIDVSVVATIPKFDPKDTNDIYNIPADSQYRELEYRRRENAISNRY